MRRFIEIMPLKGIFRRFKRINILSKGEGRDLHKSFPALNTLCRQRNNIDYSWWM